MGLSSAAPWPSVSCGGERGERRHGRPGGDRSRQEGDSSRPGGVNPGPEGQLGAPGAPRRGGESACAACCMLSLCRSVRGHPTWRQGASDGLLGGVAAARGAATLTPPAWHRAATRVSGWPAEPGLRARGQLQRPCKHGAHGGPEAAVACPGWQKYFQNGCSCGGSFSFWARAHVMESKSTVGFPSPPGSNFDYRSQNSHC